MSMTAQEVINTIANQKARKYKDLRKAIGTQRVVAKLLETTAETLCRRENGFATISRESMLAIEYLYIHNRKEITT